jgi:hypothetical protein
VWNGVHIICSVIYYKGLGLSTASYLSLDLDSGDAVREPGDARAGDPAPLQSRAVRLRFGVGYAYYVLRRGTAYRLFSGVSIRFGTVFKYASETGCGSR